MKTNMGKADRQIRIVVAIVIAVLFWKGVVSSTLGIIILVLAGVFVLTSFISFCPVYSLLGINSCPKDKK